MYETAAGYILWLAVVTAMYVVFHLYASKRWDRLGDDRVYIKCSVALLAWALLSAIAVGICNRVVIQLVEGYSGEGGSTMSGLGGILLGLTFVMWRHKLEDQRDWLKEQSGGKAK
jgi:hypothetical protein